MKDDPYKTVVASLFTDGEVLDFQKNQIVLHAQDVATGLYYINDGFVKIYTINNRGEEQIHLLYGPGDVFPLTALLGEADSNVFYQAMTDSKIAHIGLDAVQQKLQSDVKFAYAAMQKSIQQFRVYISRVHSLEHRFARERLAHRLLILAERFGVPTERGLELQAPLTQHVIASSINLSRETVSREMERFVARGYIKEISRSGGPITILDPEGLAKELPSSPPFMGKPGKLLMIVTNTVMAVCALSYAFA
jgi:CRP-like cAMP-binding protein